MKRNKKTLNAIIQQICIYAPSATRQDCKAWLNAKIRDMTIEEAFNWFLSRGLIKE